ncbi:MAG: four-carbon acid sugar kinase family protein [Microvirga sp.]|nr:four-carbon acid sugar kinase family protein [Microvirga sp.]
MPPDEPCPTPLVAIVADDLTGALDATAPFAAEGFTTCVATSPSHLAAAIAEGAQVVAVSTGSRDADALRAATLVHAASRQLHDARIPIAFKKIDSRLKGPIAAELPAALKGFGRRRALVCPAIPDLGRIVVDGYVDGFGINDRLSIKTSLGNFAGQHEIVDAWTDAQLNCSARRVLASSRNTLAVGARGLAAALARELAHQHKPKRLGTAPIRLPRPVIVGIGSRDPITLAQISALREGTTTSTIVEAPNGVFGEQAKAFRKEIVICALTKGDELIHHAKAGERFVSHFVPIVKRHLPQSLVLTGGETASAILSALGIGLLHVIGEILPGLPYSMANCSLGRIVVVTKSGGFGDPGTLLDLLDESRKRSGDARPCKK